MKQTSPAPPLQELLEGYLNTALVSMGAANGLYKSGVPKAEMVRRLTGYLARAGHVRAVLAALDPAARGALEMLQRMGGVGDAETLIEGLSDSGTATPPAPVRDYARHRPGNPHSAGREFANVMARLEMRGLVLGQSPRAYSASMTDFGVSLTYAIPSEIAKHLPPPPPPAAPRPPTFEREVLGDADAFGRQLFLTWSYFRRHAPSLLKAGVLGKRDTLALGAQFDPPPDLDAVDGEASLPRLTFQRCMLEGLDLVAWPDGANCIVDERAARLFWELPLDERVDSCLFEWQLMDGWNELERLPEANWMPAHRTQRQHLPTKLQLAREQVMQHVGTLGGDGAWVGISALARAMRLEARDFLVEATTGGHNAYGYHNSWRHGHRYSSHRNEEAWTFEPVGDDRQGWERVEVAMMRLVVQALHWLGLCDIGVDGAGPKARIEAYRLTELGRQLLAETPANVAVARKAGKSASAPVIASPAATDAERGSRVVVQPNFHVLAIGPVPEAALLRLESFADRTGTDRVLEYALTRASVYRGQLDGLNGATILATLAELSDAAVPQNVARSIEDWQRLHEQIVVHRRVTLVQTADAAAMDVLLGGGEGQAAGAALARAASSETLARAAGSETLAQAAGSAALRRAASSDTLARVVDPKAAAAALDRLGLSPANQDDPSAAGSVVWDDNGEPRPRHKVPSIYVQSHLARLAEWDAAAARWRLTAAAVQRVRAEHGLDAPAQLSAWTMLSAGAPPDWLDQRLKAWAGHYRPAKVHRRVLVELPSAEALADVRSDPRAAALIKHFKPAGPLVAVDEEDLAALRKVLEAFGIGLGG